MLCSRFGSLEMCMRKFETAYFPSSWNSMKFRQRHLSYPTPAVLPCVSTTVGSYELPIFPFSFSLDSNLSTSVK